MAYVSEVMNTRVVSVPSHEQVTKAAQLMSEHNIGSIPVVDNGQILTQGTPREVFSQVELLKQAGLDVPQVTELAFELRKAGIDLPADILTEEECAAALTMLLEEGSDCRQ